MLGQDGETNWLCIFCPKQERESKYHTLIQCVAFYHIEVFIPRIVNFVQPLTQYDQQMDKCAPLHIAYPPPFYLPLPLFLLIFGWPPQECVASFTLKFISHFFFLPFLLLFLCSKCNKAIFHM